VPTPNRPPPSLSQLVRHSRRRRLDPCPSVFICGSPNRRSQQALQIRAYSCAFVVPLNSRASRQAIPIRVYLCSSVVLLKAEPQLHIRVHSRPFVVPLEAGGKPSSKSGCGYATLGPSVVSPSKASRQAPPIRVHLCSSVVLLKAEPQLHIRVYSCAFVVHPQRSQPAGPSPSFQKKARPASAIAAGCRTQVGLAE